MKGTSVQRGTQAASRRIPLLIAALAALTPALASTAPQALADENSCRAVQLTSAPAPVPVLDWSENLGYDRQGNLWVARILRSEVQRFDRSGQLTAVVAVPFPGAVRLGPDGWMYVASGAVPTNLIPGTRNGAIVRFDPSVDHPAAQPFSTGLGMPNGMGFDAAGNLYVADSQLGVLKFGADGVLDPAWTAAAPKNFDLADGVNGMTLNGLTVAGEDVYVTVTASVTGRVLRVPIAAPDHAEVAADLLPQAATALPDDLTAVGDTLYATTTAGQLVRIDTRTHDTCTMLTGQPLTAVAADPNAPGELVLATESGDLLRVRAEH